MTLNGAIMQLVEMRENSMMPMVFKPYFDKVIETISECEEPHSQPQWIPVSERLPEFPCIVSDAHGNISTPYGIIGLSDIEHGKWYVDARNDRNEMINGQPASLLCWENRIVAWMPLPEPWKGEEE